MNHPMKLLLTILALFCVTAAPADPPKPQPSLPKFLIGVWYQPTSSFEKWKARGINTLVGYEAEGGNVSRQQWLEAARKAGFCYIVKPTDDPDELKADLADPYLLAWSQQDEPDGTGNTPPEKIVEIYKTWKAVADPSNGAESNDKPVFLNLDGNKMQWRPPADYEQYVQGGDWIAFDYYPFNGGNGAIAVLGDRLDKLRAWSGGKKKLFAFIECSDQNLKVSDWGKQIDPDGTKMRCPTAAEMKKQIEISMAHGACGIIYFPDIIGRNWEKFDGTSPDCEAAMKEVNAKLTAAAEKGLSPVTPAPRADATLEGKEVTIDGVKYKLVAADR